jgi:choice-of-anchor A domain-containing protein
MNRIKLTAVIGLGVGISSLAQAQSQLSLYNVIVKGTFSTTSDVEGKVVVGTLGSGGATLASDVTVTSAKDITVAVQSIASGNPINLENGSLYTSASPANPNERIINFNGGGSLNPSGASLNIPNVFSAITTESANYDNSSKYAVSSSTVSWSSSSGIESITLNAAPKNGVAVISLSPSDLNHANEQIQLNLGSYKVSSVIFNVSGTSFAGNSSDYWGASNIPGLASKVLWNFYQATSVALNSAWYGSILAPAATLSSSGVITGSIGVNSFTDQQEVHMAAWAGVPESSTFAAVGFVGLCGGLYTFRRRLSAVVA